MTTTIIHLMRHGEVDNPQGVLYGRLPGFRLTRRGHEMARTVAAAMARQDRDVVAVIASPLLRTQQSAAPVARAFDLPVDSDPRLIESDNVFEGLPVNSRRWQLAHPSNWRHFLRPLEPSWGEPYAAVASRMRAAVSDALQRARGHEAVLVSHQMPIVTLTRFAEGKPLAHSPLSRRCSLASVTSFLFQDSTLVGMSYDEPAAALLADCADMTPGSSAARLKR
ncbi:histidine phosphatase family protein [Schaalia sp. 19OD2882]|uniref:histidine phosphatase family protein n=1 Tax=Schaalia sp. 19OD2882 TaxID=2794089 RepID=UPI001C1EAB02|nr:histidine phosphatase family protein [Schaalia sp. 19OD2882]QWW19870.1 histidine phosphatase family protein [Schaalia sp. 19OD2882]